MTLPVQGKLRQEVLNEVGKERAFRGRLKLWSIMHLGCPVNTFYAVQFIPYLCLSQTNITSLPDIVELVVHIPHVVFDVDSDAGRLQHLHGELLREGTNKQSSDSVDAGDLIRHADLFGVVPVLQVQHTCRQKE